MTRYMHPEDPRRRQCGRGSEEGIRISWLWRDREAKSTEEERVRGQLVAAARVFDEARSRLQVQRAALRSWPPFGRAHLQGRTLSDAGYIVVVTDPDDDRFAGKHFPHERSVPAVPPTERRIYWEAIRTDLSKCGFHFMLTAVDIPRKRFWAVYDWSEGPIEKAVYVFRRQP